jgi:S1-C subfamily serine protease
MLWMFLSCMLSFQEEGDLKSISVEQTKAAHHFNYDKPIKSSVRIVAMSDKETEAGHGSGNYFKIGRHRFVLTAAHVVADDNYTMYVQDGGFLVESDVVYLDKISDIAIIVPKANLTIKPINYKRNKTPNVVGETVVYAGFPADFGLSVFNGTVSVCSTISFIMQSFALPGSSGSVVFDNKGRVMGVVSALKMGFYPHSPFPQLHPTMVYVARTNSLSRQGIEEIIVKWNSLK